MKELRKKLEASSKRMLGYPINCNSKMAEALGPFTNFVINNLGDPFAGGNYNLNTFEMEVEVVQFIADLYKLENPWGYVTNGGSEGNLKGLWMGVERFPEGIIYHSDKSHYSVMKAARMMRTPSVSVDTDGTHAMDVDDFAHKVDRSKPAIVNVNFGTTMAGAIDDLNAILDCLKDMDFYIHIDAALSGLMLPYIEDSPKIDFSMPIGSVSVSGHKLIGCPSPCGVIVSRSVSAESVEYINSVDSTVFGSRDGHSALALWYALKSQCLNNSTKKCLELTNIAEFMLNRISWENWKNPFSNTIMLKRPSDNLVTKWQLAVEGEWAHIILMPHVDLRSLRDFVNDLEDEACTILKDDVESAA